MSSSTTVAPTGSIQSNATNATSTVLVLPQLTTPFVPPTQCTPVQNWTPATVSVTTDGFDFGKLTYSQILFPVTDAQFSACQPSGWDKIASQNRFRYSSAVCPSGYNYNQLSDLYSGQTNAETILTTAYCCPSGFAYTFFYESSVGGIFGDNCVRTTSLGASTNSTSSTASANTTVSASVTPRDVSKAATITTGPGPNVATMVYTPWRIEWEKKDATQLSPSPPLVSVQVPVSTWVPGTEIDASLTRKVSNPNALSKGVGQVIGIVVGCVVAAFAAIGIVCAWLFVRSRRRRRQQFEQEEQELQDRRLARLAEYQRSRDPADDEPLPVYVKARDQDGATGTSLAVPPYKERPSEDSSRDGRHQDERQTGGTGNSRNDDDQQRLHDVQIQQENITPQNTRQRRSGRPRRQE